MRLFLTLLFVFASNSWALQCGELSSEQTIAENLNKHIFTALVTEAKIVDDKVVAKFNLIESFKGSPETLESVSTYYDETGSLGIVVGRKYFFIVTELGIYNICSGSGLLDWSDYSELSFAEYENYQKFYRELRNYYRAYNKRLWRQ
ncbi:hypothetical protein [Pseudoalteromonas xiamenensis]